MFTILISWSPVCSPLIPCYYHWNRSWLWLKQHTERNVERGKSCNMIRVKESEGRPFIFISRLNIVQLDSHQADEIVMEIEDGNKTLRTIMCCSSLIIVNSWIISIFTCKRYDSCLILSLIFYNVFQGITNTCHPGQNIWK